MNVDPSMTLTYGGVIAGASTITKSGTGTLILSGANTHTGTTAVSAGVMRIQSNAALGGTGDRLDGRIGRCHRDRRIRPVDR